MTEQELRRELSLAARRLQAKGLVAAWEGNLSARLADGEGPRRHPGEGPAWLCSPTRRCKEDLRPRDFLRVDGRGEVQGGALSSEWELHLGVYRHLPEARAVVHAHPPYCTAFACTEGGLAPLLQPELLLLLGGPVPLAPYARPGTSALFDSVRPLLAASPVILLAGHGALAVSRSTPLEACLLLEQVEQVARVTWLARQLGGLRPLSAADLRDLMD